MKNSKVYCPGSVCSFLVTIFKFYYFYFVPIRIGELQKCGCGVAGGCFTDVATQFGQLTAEPRWLPKDASAAWGAVMLFPQSSQSVHVVIYVQEAM